MYGASSGHVYAPHKMPRDVVYERPANPVKYKDIHFPERDWSVWELDLLEYEDDEIRAIQETSKISPELAKVHGCTGYTPFLRLQSVVMPWTFAPDIMHLKDENVMKAYLKLWMGT